MQNVVGTKGHGWFMLLSDQGREQHYVYKWTLHLECGHQVEHLSEKAITRGTVVPPSWVHCKICQAEAG